MIKTFKTDYRGNDVEVDQHPEFWVATFYADKVYCRAYSGEGVFYKEDLQEVILLDYLESLK